MGLLKMSPVPTCSANKHCAEWARIYLKYCLCGVRDGASLTLGLVSVLSWGVAEVPQIITNYKEKSTMGLSLAFLMTWIVGDLFNLVGCLLEPATLPTQFYMALLYTATTTLLTAQTIYYGHIYPHIKARKRSGYHEDKKMVKKGRNDSLVGDIISKSTNDLQSGPDVAKEGFQFSSLPIPVAASATKVLGSPERNLYYVSARSLSRSPKPTTGSFPVHTHDIGPLPSRICDQQSTREPLLREHHSSQSAPLRTKSMLSVVLSAALLLVGMSLHLSEHGRFDSASNTVVILVGRKLLQIEGKNALSSVHGGGSNGVGSFLGWAMAFIYMGGRLPQIFLNIRRGTVEGLNPLMFGFAVVGNSTYVASILVNSTEWAKLKPNLPWLVDAGGCVILDTFILMQFIHFRCWKHKPHLDTHAEE